MADLILMLGELDPPFDAVQEYSNRLSDELGRQGRTATTIDCDWHGQGLRAFRDLRHRLATERPAWVMMHFTPVSWGPHALPIPAVIAAEIIRRSGARFALDLGIGSPQGGPGLHGRFRGWVQLKVFQRLAKRSDRIFVHIRPEIATPWLPRRYEPVLLVSGTNVTPLEPPAVRQPDAPLNIMVFCLTDSLESGDGQALADIMRRSAPDLPDGTVLTVMGRGAETARPLVQAALEGTSLVLDLRGFAPEEEVAAAFGTADIYLFVRGGITSYRSTAVAALDHGLPIIAFETDETAWPITEAGVICVPFRDVDAAAEELVRVANDADLRRSLGAKSREAFERYFSWNRIAETVANALDPGR